MPNPIRSFLDRPNEDPVKTFGVAVAVALVCALVISSTAVLLDPIQKANIAREQQARMDRMLDTLPGLRDLMVETGVTALETRVLDMRTGWFAADADATGFDYDAAIQSEDASIAVTEEKDLARLRRIPALMPVHLLQREGTLMLIVLPVRGAGYASTIKASLALEPTLDTIAALTILEQADTPGLGGRIEEPEWQAQWAGTALRNDEGALAVAVVKGGASEPWEVDGITGATNTSNGVQNMLRFWLGERGYGPFLERLREEGL